jgi:predicted RNA-binding protein YlqC (UPF0109 family)
MKQILETIIKNIVENPDEVTITEKEEETKVIFEVKVAEADMGRIIGKQGKVANSIRTLMRALNSKDKKKISIEFLD